MGRRIDDPLLIWPSCPKPTYSEPSTGDEPSDTIPAERIDPDPAVVALFERVGAAISGFMPANVVPVVAARFADVVPTYVAARAEVTPDTQSGVVSRSTLQWVPPADADPVATTPEPPKKSYWCVPQTLYDQIERLAAHPYSALWASHVSNQLSVLTERDYLEGDDVQPILADLSDAAQEAFLMADHADDDRLRVELLRAHWALARRLDRWAAMHEERMAYRSQGRVAARGELSPYFDSAPADPPTPADVAQLSTDLETYEATRDPQLGRLVVERQRALAESPASFDRALADAVEQHDRNANVRVAITAEMVNRMVAAERSERRPVRESIAGAFVRGQSDVTSKSVVELTPAHDEWGMKVQTRGIVESNTFANAGPVRLRSRGATEFSGSKSVVVRPDGVHLQPSDVAASSRSRLVGVTTDYDWVPLVGGMTRDRAVQEYQAKQSWVRSAMESRVSDEAGETLDRDTHEAMERARQRLYVRFTEDFDEYGIKLTTIEMKSSPERLVARMRVARDDQLGSHTPRPRALSDSLASVQLHESAMNNMAITLGLDGQRLTGDELQAKLREQFPQLAERDQLETRRDTVFHFAPKDAVQFRIGNGQLELQVTFDNVELDGVEIPHITVHAHYAPVVSGLQIELQRDGALGIEGRVSAGERARLHNIFKTVFPPDRPLRLVRLDDEDQRLDGLMITQLVLEDGWIGWAIGPESTNRVAERSRSLR
jgi:hypothetical protein